MNIYQIFPHKIKNKTKNFRRRQIFFIFLAARLGKKRMARPRNSSKAPAKKNSKKEKPVKRLDNKKEEVVKNPSVVDKDSKAEEWTGRKIVKV